MGAVPFVVLVSFVCCPPGSREGGVFMQFVNVAYLREPTT